MKTWEAPTEAVIHQKCETFHEKLPRVIPHNWDNNFKDEYHVTAYGY